MALTESQHPYHYTIEEYLEIERNAEIKHEYVNGEILAMSGASNNHNIIAGNIITQFNILLRDTDCIVHPGDSRVRIPGKRSYRYPDVVVVCDDPQFDDDTPPSLLNPTILVEILSPSTASQDQIQKRDEYLAIPSIQAYLLISQDKAKIEYYLHDPNNPDWRYNAVTDIAQSVTLPNPACTLTLNEVYRKVTFETSEDEA